MDGIALSAIIKTIRTTVDGGWAITFEVPQSEVTQVMQLSSMREYPVQLGVVPEPARIQESD
jgi:hypothetical protein